jgi:transketolase
MECSLANFSNPQRKSNLSIIMNSKAANDLNDVSHDDMANAIRALAMDAVQAANSGHPGAPMGMADMATVLFTQYLKFDPAHPDWADRDRFILSNGHASMLLYSLLHLTGYEGMDIDQLRNFRQLGSRTAGHPEYGHAAGIETTTGPLGQGIGNAVGMAISERLLNARFGDDIVDHRTYVFAGDGCLMEGISHEAISLAGHLKLHKLTVLFDDNEICIDGATTMTVTDDQQKRFQAAGWHTQAIDGHDPDAIADAIEAAQASDRPSMIACRTVIGFGAPNKQGTAATHGAPLGDEEIAAARKALSWPHDPFVIPTAISDAWKNAGARGRSDREAWTERLASIDTTKRETFERTMSGKLPPAWPKALQNLKKSIASEPKKIATRQASLVALDALTPVIPEMIGGSADLTGSNLTKAKDMTAVSAENFAGNYMYYGVREHGMAAAMNGMALHGGVIPYGGTFLIFTDYCRPSIRLSALMKQRVIYVMSHDSIGLGEDGPTHQPVEHLAALRAIPNVKVFRPADTMETAECWALAIESTTGPSIIALTRQGVEQVRTEYTDENVSSRGAYVLKASDGDRQATLIASGSEVEIALAAQKILQAGGVPTAVVSAPCLELFNAQDEAYRHLVLGPDRVRVAIEAACGFGWERYIGMSGGFIGMDGFGASAPAGDLYKHFGITADAVVDAVKERL